MALRRALLEPRGQGEHSRRERGSGPLPPTPCPPPSSLHPALCTGPAPLSRNRGVEENNRAARGGQVLVTLEPRNLSCARTFLSRSLFSLPQPARTSCEDKIETCSAGACSTRRSNTPITKRVPKRRPPWGLNPRPETPPPLKPSPRAALPKIKPSRERRAGLRAKREQLKRVKGL